MKTNNRPMVKEIKDIDMGYAGREVIEVERPMNEAEYIEYLEEQVSDTFGKLVSVEELSKQTISTLEKENQELKDKYDRKTSANQIFRVVSDMQDKLIEKYKIELEQQQDQFLKVVESVVNTHQLESYDYDTCKCGEYCSWTIYKTDWTYEKHLLQEIKSAMEKEKDANQRKD